MRAVLRRTARLLLFAALVLGAAACDGDGPASNATPTRTDAEPVSVLGIWSGEELASFEAMLSGWDGAMDFTGTRDITTVLATRVSAGNPPDIAIPAEIGSLGRFARAGAIVPLSACEGLEPLVRSKYPQAFLDLATVDGILYGFFMKADSKATIFYNPRVLEASGVGPLGDQGTLEDLLTLADAITASGTPAWSMGQEAGGGSGFPGSDTIQQILLNEAGADVYDGLVAGRIPFTDPRVRAAWEAFGAIALKPGAVAQGDGPAINSANFEEAATLPFEDPPRAAMVALGSFASGFIGDRFPEAEPGKDFDFFTWPGGAVTGGANVAFAFNSDPETCSLLRHMASAEAQTVWVKRGGFISLNIDVALEDYPDAVARQLAERLTAAQVFRFDLDDAIGGAVQQAIFRGVLDYLAGPSQLDAILQRIEDRRR